MRQSFFIPVAALAILVSPGSPQFITTADAGGYVAPVLDFTPIAAPLPAPAAFTLCGEPMICVGLALAMMAFLIQSGGGSDNGSGAELPPAPTPPFPTPPVEPPMPPVQPPVIPAVPLPATGPLLLGGLAAAALIRRRATKRR